MAYKRFTCIIVHFEAIAFFEKLVIMHRAQGAELSMN
jgi:hypothetical protein